jgi:hypothetical protein
MFGVRGWLHFLARGCSSPCVTDLSRSWGWIVQCTSSVNDTERYSRNICNLLQPFPHRDPEGGEWSKTTCQWSKACFVRTSHNEVMHEAGSSMSQSRLGTKPISALTAARPQQLQQTKQRTPPRIPPSRVFVPCFHFAASRTRPDTSHPTIGLYAIALDTFTQGSEASTTPPDPITRTATLAMSEENEETSQPRASRFREHTNTNNSIRPPPDELWKDLGIEQLIEQFNEENAKPPVSRKVSANRVPSAPRPALERNASSGSGFGTTTSVTGRASTSTQPATPAPHEGTYARFRSAVASVFGNVLGKRKASALEAVREKTQQQQLLDERKKAAETAYHDAKDRGLLPTPKVFVRPNMRAASHGTPAPPLDKLRLTAAIADAATPIRVPRTPRTPGALHHTPSKKDLHKQKKLSKRVSDLEFKLASARKELQTVLHSDVAPVPLHTSLQRANQQPTPDVSQSENEVDATSTSPEVSCSIGKIVKKRKASSHDEDAAYKPIITDSDGDIDLLSEHAHTASEQENEMPTPERMIKRVKSSASRKNLKRQSSRLQSRLSRGSLRERNGSQEREVRVVPDGEEVPDVPVIPREMESLGRRTRVRDDGFGGLGHEIF